MPGRKVQVRITIHASRLDRSVVNIVPLDKEQPVKQSQWRNRVYLWPQKAADAVIVAKDDHYIVVAEEGRLIAVYGYAADSRKYGDFFAAVLRVKEGAKAEGERVGCENCEIIAEAVGSKINDIVAEMALNGYHAASSESTKRAANVAAYLALKALQKPAAEEGEEKAEQQSAPAEQKPAEVKQSTESAPAEAGEKREESEEDELLREIEEARRRLAQLGAEEQQSSAVTPAERKQESTPAEAKEEAAEKREEKREEKEEPSPFAKAEDYVVWVNGQPFLRLWLVKTSKPSEYLGSRQTTKTNGAGEIEVVKKLKPWASKLETARRKLNDILRGSVYVWRADGYFGYNTSIRVIFDPRGFKELAEAYAAARNWLIATLRKANAPREVLEYVEREFKPRPVPMLVPLEAGIAILRAIRAWYLMEELPRVREELRKHQEKRNKKMARKLEQELEALKRQLESLQKALAELEKRYAQSA